MARGQRNLSTDTARLPGFGGGSTSRRAGAEGDNGRAPRRSPRSGRAARVLKRRDCAAEVVANDDPDHVRFVPDRRMPEVTDFLELDYAAR